MRHQRLPGAYRHMTDGVPEAAAGPVPGDALQLAIVIPVYNNAAVLPRLHERLSDALSALGHDYQLIFVNDHSRDRSGPLLDTLAEKDRRVKVVHLPENGGQNRAICQGMGHSRAQKVAVMDADLQDRPEHLEHLLQAHHAPGDAVFLRRTTPYQGYVRMASSRLFKRLLGLLTGLDPRAGSYFVIDRSIAEQLAQEAEHAPVVTVLVAQFAGQIIYVDGERDEAATASNYSTLGRIAYGQRAIRCALRARWRGRRVGPARGR